MNIILSEDETTLTHMGNIKPRDYALFSYASRIIIVYFLAISSQCFCTSFGLSFALNFSLILPVFLDKMILTYCCIIALIHSATASDPLEQRVPRGSFRMPLQFALAERDETIDGFALMSLDEMYFVYRPTYEHNSESSINYIVARSIVFPGDDTRIDLGNPTRFYDESLSERNALYLMDVNSVLMSPATVSEDILVIGPSNPSDYALEGHLYYARMTPDDFMTGLWTIPTALRFASGGESVPTYTADTGFMSCRSSTSETDHIQLPGLLIQEFMFRAGSWRINTDTEDLSIILVGVTQAELETLPSFNVIIETVNGSEVQIGTIEPLHYMVPTEVPNDYRVFFHAEFTIPKRVIKDLVIHIDYQNLQIGFGNPLNDS